MDSFTAFATTDVQILSEAGVFGSDKKEEFIKNGKLPLKIISPGWGSSGYYGPDILAEAAANQIFPAGTKMFWDHPSITEAIERPERSLRDLAATFDKPARWDPKGPKGPGLYTDVTVLTQFREAVWEMAPHIGPSIRAVGPVKFGEAEGKKGPIVEGIIAAQSVDFVTAPGRGGEILQLFEAARPAVNPVTPVVAEPGPTPPPEENNVQLEEATRQLSEAQTKVTQLTEANATLTKERDEAIAKASRLADGFVLREAKDFVQAELAKNTLLPDIVKSRLVETISRNPAKTDAGELDKTKLGEQLTEAVKSEVAYIAAITGSGNPTGVGTPPGTDGSGDPVTTGLEEAFRALGMDEKAAKVAAGGRA